MLLTVLLSTQTDRRPQAAPVNTGMVVFASLADIAGPGTVRIVVAFPLILPGVLEVMQTYTATRKTFTKAICYPTRLLLTVSTVPLCLTLCSPLLQWTVEAILVPEIVVHLPIYYQIVTVPLALPGIFAALQAMEAVAIFKRRSLVKTITYSQRLLITVSPCACRLVTSTNPRCSGRPSRPSCRMSLFRLPSTHLVLCPLW